MRISDDRYSRERLCLDLALRFLRHEARTQTIRTWTGLTDDRIRKLQCSGYKGFNSRHKAMYLLQFQDYSIFRRDSCLSEAARMRDHHLSSRAT